MSTPQTQAVGLVNSLISLVDAVVSSSGAIDDLFNLWTNAQTGNIVRAFPTRALNADGTLGDVDAAPDATHPMDIMTAGSPAAGITRALSSNDVAGIITSLLGVRDVVQGKGVAANGATVQLFAKCLGS